MRTIRYISDEDERIIIPNPDVLLHDNFLKAFITQTNNGDLYISELRINIIQ